MSFKMISHGAGFPSTQFGGRVFSSEAATQVSLGLRPIGAKLRV